MKSRRFPVQFAFLLLVTVSATAADWPRCARAQILTGKCWTNPALSGGRLYARNAKGTLVCVELATGNAASPK